MIYYYDIHVEYFIGKQKVIKIYVKSFNEIVDFMIWLKEKHKNNFTILKIREHKRYGSKFNKIFYEEFIKEEK